jgi:3',5'-cyclic-AMP phosphodiesterase
MKIIQLSDLHLTLPGVELRGLDPERRLRDCLVDIEACHRDAVALVVSGDLTEAGDPLAYRLLRDVLSDYRLPPTYLAIGNHDDRRNFARAFPLSVDDETGFAHCSFSLGDHLGLVLDTWEAGTHAGRLCSRRLAWLHGQLESAARPVLVFAHHAPFKIGLKRLDQMILDNGDELWSTIDPFRDRIRHLFFGHMHRTLSGNWRGVPFSVAPSTVHHGLLEFDSDRIRSAIADPFYSVILVQDGNVIVHTKQLVEHWTIYDPKPSAAAPVPALRD